MVTSIDEGKGLVKVFWEDVRDRVAKIDPVFAEIIDNLSPDHTFPIYLAYYPYGEIIGDTERLYLPKLDGGVYSLFDPCAPKDILKHLGYAKNSFPLGMVLDKNIEYFFDYKEESLSIPWFIFSPGRFFPSGRILSPEIEYPYSTNTVLTMASGARSAFMLPHIGCTVNHNNLQREFDLELTAAKSLYKHCDIFKALVNSKTVNSDWRSCLMYFGEKWVTHLHNDDAWIKLQLYLHKLAWRYTEYIRNSDFFDTTFSVIQKKRNLKPNPYLADTSKYLFLIAMGAATGYVPATNNNALPKDTLQKLFVEFYRLEKYVPTILHPALFNIEQDEFPAYYSLQYPSTHEFSPKSRRIVNTLFELGELQHITKIFKEELSKDGALCSDTILNLASKNIEFNYFHSKHDRYHKIMPAANVENFDPRFKQTYDNLLLSNAKFCSASRFLRGCISIRNLSTK